MKTTHSIAVILCVLVVVVATVLGYTRLMRREPIEDGPPIYGAELSIDKVCGATYAVGEQLHVRFRTNVDGYVTIVTRNAHGEFFVLFPDSGTPDNVISAQTPLTLPPETSRYALLVEGPSGPKTVYALFSHNSAYHWTYPHLELQKIQSLISAFSESVALDYTVAACELTVKAKVVDISTTHHVIILDAAETSRDIVFGEHSVHVNEESYQQLDQVVDILQRYPGTALTVSGHADIRETGTDTLLLSEERARTIANYFIEHGIAETRIVTVGYGTSQPCTGTETAHGCQHNRRVELYLAPGEQRYEDERRSVRNVNTVPDRATPLSTVAPSRRTQSVASMVVFDGDSASMGEINEASTQFLQMIGKMLQQQSEMKMVVAGHTSPRGTSEENMELSLRRAQAVKDFLVSQFQIGEERLVVKGYGEKHPIESSDSHEGTSQNDRVEFVRIE
jgi:outer membrane protein OmpA-like peptidoglycan-associated protein